MMKSIWIVSLCLWMSCAMAFEQTLSPGPRGLIDDDFRVPVTVLETPKAEFSGNYLRWMEDQGVKRYYEAYVPNGYVIGKKIPVVMVLHGGGGHPAQIRYTSQMNAVADRYGFIVVYPSGTGSHFNYRLLYWNSGPERKDKNLRDVDDVLFLNRVLDDINHFFTVDQNRVYVTGISNGGQMAYRLGAALSYRIAAIAPVSGDRTIGQFWGVPKRPLPVMAFHGMQDTWLTYEGGGTPESSGFAAVNRISVMDTVKGWVEQAGGNPEQPEVTLRGKAILYRYPSIKPNGVESAFWVLTDGGHTWPGGKTTRITELAGVGNTSHDIDASTEMWLFFSRQTLK